MTVDHTIISSLHDKAMALAEQADIALRAGLVEQAQQDLLEAFENERAAAMLLVNAFHEEPTRSVLFRSAASLLLNLPDLKGEYWRQAEQMVAFGLSGNPPEEIALELREIWNEVMEHLQSTAA